MLRFYAAVPLVAILFVVVLFGAQGAPERRPQTQQPTERVDGPMKEAVVERKARSATVKANSARPLAQALAAIREEYGWQIDYEDPPYASEPDLVDITNAQWRARNPGAPGVKGIAGGKFESEYDEGDDLEIASGKERVLQKVVSDYNRSQNPGRFIVRAEGTGGFAIIGSVIKRGSHDEDVLPVLDTRVSVELQERTAEAAVSAILQAVANGTNSKLVIGTVPTNLFLQAKVTVGGDNVEARSLLRQTLDATGRPLHWQLLYDPTTGKYFLNIAIATRSIQNTFGQKSSVPIDYSPLTRVP
jgi:hypothetical protein